MEFRHFVWVFLVSTILFDVLLSAPVDPKKKDDDKKDKTKKEEEALDEIGLEYGRYLQQVVQALEEDKDFAKKLENISNEQIRTGQIAHELEFVKHNIRTKLDELKRIEIDRLRKLIQEQMERTELGLNRNNVKIPMHLDIDNPHSFEVSDLKKLIQTATKDLEELDRQRREDFKKYEMEKEMKYRDSLVNMTEEEKKETEKHHVEMIEKHKDHPKVHHPGSKPQLEQVWEDEDHMPKEEFNPKTFFALHDINGDGHLDEKEVEALLMPEIRKMYDPKNEEDDPAEMEEEYHRMREHIFNETDNNKDGLISLEEFMKMTQQSDFEQDEGWKGLDEQSVYSEDEIEEYMRQRHMEMQQYGDPRAYYDVPHAQPGVPPPHINYPQQHHPDMQPQYHQPVYPQQGQHPQQFQGVPPQHYQQQPQYQGVPPQHQQQQYQVPQHQQQQYQVPQHQQQQYQGVPPPHQQQYQGVPPQQHQQQFQGVPPPHQQQQQFQGMPPQQHGQGVPPQQQQVHGVPPPQQQQYQNPPPQQHPNAIPQQQQQARAVPPQQAATQAGSTGGQPNPQVQQNVGKPDMASNTGHQAPSNVPSPSPAVQPPSPSQV